MKLRGLLAVLALSTAALAGKAETDARSALAKARADYDAGELDRGLARIDKAFKACRACADALRAELLRDAGVMRARKGDAAGALADFGYALKMAPGLALPAAYDHPDVRAAWQKAREQTLGIVPLGEPEPAAAPKGDFSHKPWPEQRANTPLPLYVELEGRVSRVVVVYQAEGDGEWKRLRLRRVGKGWGAAVPCADVRIGAVAYYVQGFDGDDLVAASGDKRHAFRTAIRASIEGVTPHLPGRPAPHGCDLGKGCEVEPYACGANEPGAEETGAVSSRLWIGVAGAVGFTAYGGGSNVCRLAPDGSATSGWLCTDPSGEDFPTRRDASVNDGIMDGGRLDSGAVPTAIRIMAAVDYAVTDNLLVGARIGYVHGAYPGAHVSVPAPLHLEARAAWVFGEEPLARTGFAPAAMVGLGTTRLDAPAAVEVVRAGIAGPRTEVAWRVGGPFFAGFGGGFRYAFSPRAAFTALLRFDAALGGLVVVPAGNLEGTLQWGF